MTAGTATKLSTPPRLSPKVNNVKLSTKSVVFSSAESSKETIPEKPCIRFNPSLHQPAILWS